MKHTFLFILSALIFIQPARSQDLQPADQIVALVNDHIILKSDIDIEVANYLRQASSYGQQVQFTEQMWYDFLKSSIENYVLIEKARVDSIEISDEQVNRSMDQRVGQLIQQAGSEEALEQAFGKPIIQLREEFRDNFREQMLVDQVRQMKFMSVKITRPEVREFFEAIPKDSLPTIPEQVALSQIVIVPPPKTDAKNETLAFAEQLRDSILTHGVPFDELARRHGTDASASRGGLLPMMSLNDLVAEYSAAASALRPGQISEVVETEFGYHIIKLERRMGDQIETRHILLRTNQEQLDDAFAINRLTEIRDSLLADPSLSFSEFALRVSEDPISKTAGGKILDPQTGERLIPLNRLDPALYRIVLLMDEEGTISEPKPFTPSQSIGKAYRIVRLDQQVSEHIANFEQDYERLKNIALQQKQYRVYEEWLQDLKDQFYIEYRIPMPNTEIN